MIRIVGPVAKDPLSYLKKELQEPNGIIVALDGGATLLHQVGILPDLWFGDMDSIDSSIVDAYTKTKVKTFCFPREKDFSDFELAIQHIVSNESAGHKVILYGMLGGRLDHMLFNLEAIKVLLAIGCSISFRSHKLDLYLMQKNSSLKINTLPGHTISLLPFLGEVFIKRTEGLKYTLSHELLKPATTRGLSNVASANEVALETKEGYVIIFHYKELADENFSGYCKF